MAQITKVSKWGNSLAIRIPSNVVYVMGLQAGDELRLHQKDNFILLEADKSDSKQFEEWLNLFNLGQVNIDYDSWIQSA